MSRLELVKQQRNQRKKRVRAVVTGTSKRPRLSVFISAKHVTAQLIDDTNSKTLVYVSTVGEKQRSESNMTKKASDIGVELAKKARSLKIKAVVFDRGSRIYHGRVKALAESAREGGLEF